MTPEAFLKFVLIPLILSVLVTSCVTYRLQPLAQPGSEVRQTRGQDWSVATKDGVTVEASAHWAPEIRFDLQVLNKSGQTVTVNSDQFRLYAGEPGSWKEIAFVPGGEYYRRAEAEIQARPTVTIVTSDAPVVRRRTTTTTTIVGNDGNSMTIIRTNPEPVYVPGDTRTLTIVPSNQGRLNWLKDNLFFSATLQPGTDHAGSVFADPVRETFYKLVVPVEGKDYELVFERVKERGPFMNLN